MGSHKLGTLQGSTGYRRRMAVKTLISLQRPLTPDKKGDHIMTTLRKTLGTSLAAALLAGVTTLAQGQTGGGDAVTGQDPRFL